MKELQILLEKLWIRKEEDRDLYYRVKDAYPKMKEFIVDKLGYKIIITPYLIKLEKRPGRPEPWMGIQSFTNRLEYAFLCLLLIFLEDKGPEEQFLLSQTIDFIITHFPKDQKERIDWTLYSHRRHLVKVMRYAEEIGLMKNNDGDDHNFMTNTTGEVLYENTGLSRYFMQNFSQNILHCASYKDFTREEKAMEDQRDRGRIRRNRVYRRLFLSPVIYNEGKEDADYLYIKNYRQMLEKEVKNQLDGELHIHKNGAFIVLSENSSFKDVFPTNKTLSDIVLQINGAILDLLEENQIEMQIDDTIPLTMNRFYKIIEYCRKSYRSGWCKHYRLMKMERVFDEIIDYMKGFGMLRVDMEKKIVTILPLVGVSIGKYPEEYRNIKREDL